MEEGTWKRGADSEEKLCIIKGGLNEIFMQIQQSGCRWLTNIRKLVLAG